MNEQNKQKYLICFLKFFTNFECEGTPYSKSIISHYLVQKRTPIEKKEAYALNYSNKGKKSPKKYNLALFSEYVDKAAHIINSSRINMEEYHWLI